MSVDNAGEEVSDETGSEEASGDEEETSSDSNTPEDDDEPILKYKRFAKGAIHSIHQNTKNFITCIAVHEKVGIMLCISSVL